MEEGEGSIIKIGEAGETEIPQTILDHLGLCKGDQVCFEALGTDCVVVRKYVED